MLTPPETETIQVPVDQLRVSPGEIGRYAGGTRYQLDEKMKALAADALAKARTLVTPMFTFALHPIEFIERQNEFRLQSGDYIDVPLEEKDPQTVSLAAVICTLGSELENSTHQLMQKGDLLTAIFLDAAGVAQLELLAYRARKHIKKKAAKCGLFSGCPFGPGYTGMPIDSQRILFEHVDAEAIGVRLNHSGMMLPMKSISFWLRLTRNAAAAEDRGYKCQKCDMETCLYRKVPYKKN